MKFLKKLWHQFTQAVDEFIADLIGKDTLAQAELEPDQISELVKTDSYESW